MPHEPSHFEQPKNWPKIILITIAVIILIGAVTYFIINSSGKRGDNNSNLNPEQNNIVNNNSGVLPANNYDCSSDLYNCNNFTTQSAAQVAFDSCKNQGAGDVWGLDNDGDGRVCESLSQ